MLHDKGSLPALTLAAWASLAAAPAFAAEPEAAASASHAASAAAATPLAEITSTVTRAARRIDEVPATPAHAA